MGFKVLDRVRLKGCLSIGIITSIGATLHVLWPDGFEGLYNPQFVELVAMGSGGAGSMVSGQGGGLPSGTATGSASKSPYTRDDYGYYGEGIIPQLAPLAPPKACDCGGFKTFGIVSKETCVHWCSTQKA